MQLLHRVHAARGAVIAVDQLDRAQDLLRRRRGDGRGVEVCGAVALQESDEVSAASNVAPTGAK